jgi:trigger factor
MELKFEVERVDAVRRRVAIEVAASVVSSELDRAYSEIARKASVPGFRRGRVPQPVVERLFGEHVRSQVVDRLIQQSFLQAVEEGSLPVVGHPEFETEALARGLPLRFTAVLEVKPDIRVDNYRGLAVEKPVFEITDADVDHALAQLREAHAHLYPIEDRADARMGDVVTIKYEAMSAGRMIGSVAEREIELGRSGLAPEFDQNLAGALVDSSLRFTVDYPENHSNRQLAGRVVEFNVQVQGLARKELPALDDDFAKTVGDCDTLDALREKIRNHLKANAARRAEEVVRQRLVEVLLSLHRDIPVPRALVERRLDALVDEVWADWRRQRIQPRDERMARDRLRRDLEPQAESQVRAALLLDAVARQESLMVSEEEVDAYIDRQAEQIGEGGVQIRALYQTPSARRELRAGMLHSRALDVILKSAQVRDEPTETIADGAKNG